jgi:thymidylate kinase
MGEVICQARRIGDEMCCNRCRIRWDAAEEAPETCEAVAAKPRTLAERMRIVNNALRDVTTLPSLCADMEDLIEEVALLEQRVKSINLTGKPAVEQPGVVLLDRYRNTGVDGGDRK